MCLATDGGRGLCGRGLCGQLQGSVSPTRSPSPLAFPLVHQAGSSHSTQVFSPGASLSVSPATKRALAGAGQSAAACSSSSFSGSSYSSSASAGLGVPQPRPKSAEPAGSSPLLRRALSPDRLHPRSAEKSLAISPLCCSSSAASGSRFSFVCVLPSFT